jgi:hypothetical protein
MRQASHVTGMRQARYLGLPKTQLEHNAAAAINTIRMDAYWTGHPWTAHDQATSPGASPQMLTRYGASARSARARRTYDRIMADT